MSYRPHLFGLYDPTLLVRRRYSPFSAPPKGKLPLKLPSLLERDLPTWKGVSVPARQQYSHSASVGRRYLRPAFFSSALALSLARNCWTSSHETRSTGNSSRSFSANCLTLSLPPPLLLKWL